MMNPMHVTIEKLRVRQILDLLPSLASESIDRIIAEAQVELYVRADEEQAKQDYDALCLRDDLLYGRTNALEGIK